MSLTIEQVLACPSLPSLPSIATEVLELTRDKDVKLNKIAEVVQNDQALSARILKTVNSSYYGLSKPCPTISRALAYLGLNTVKSLVLGFSLVDCTQHDDDEFDLIDYWRRCLYSAAAARRLATMNNLADPEEVFLAALMQDIGMLAMNTVIKQEYAKVIEDTQGDHNKLCDLEKAAFGFNHSTVGAELGEKWRLPPQIIECIRHHHDVNPMTDLELVRMVSLGMQLANALFMESSDQPPIDCIRNEAREWFGFGDSEMDELASAIVSDAAELGRLFKVDLGTVPDAGSILAQAEEASIEHQLAMQRDAEMLAQSNQELSHQALTDGLTNIGNRLNFDQTLGNSIEQARNSGAELGLILFDADKFKSFNDTYGHQAGDAVLVEIARRATEAAGDDGQVFRYGGEEFVVILENRSRVDSTRVAERIRKAMEAAPFDLSDVDCGVDEVPVTVSLGVACRDATSAGVFESPDALIQGADRAVYAAKDAGRNCVRVFTLRAAA